MYLRRMKVWRKESGTSPLDHVNNTRIMKSCGLLNQWNISFLDAEVLGDLFAEGINLVLVLPMNYLVNKLWAFRQKKRVNDSVNDL